MPESKWTPELIVEHFTALLEQRDRAVSTANAEREKAAQALQSATLERVAAGDDNLLQHIQAQKDSVVAAFKASETAIGKAEDATDNKVQVGYDNLRRHIDAQLQTIDRMNQEIDKCLQRETYDTMLSEWTVWRRAISDELSAMRGRTAAYATAVGFLVIFVNVALFIIGHH